ncbi:hypothetical protein [Marinobacter sediminicola]|uniref:hypothetical protein n=1 Tax=Marinobacter sediminicola TaxID=3072994 RepID=UPI002811FB76|nr:hypothetical protein [Marinobacter sp. F26243]
MKWAWQPKQKPRSMSWAHIALGVGVFALTYFGAALFDSSLIFLVGTGAAIAFVLDAIRLRARVGILCVQLVERSAQLDYGLVPVKPEPSKARAAQLEEIERDKDSSARRIWNTMQARHHGLILGGLQIAAWNGHGLLAKEL